MATPRFIKQPDTVSRAFEIKFDDWPMSPTVKVTVTAPGDDACKAAAQVIRNALQAAGAT